MFHEGQWSVDLSDVLVRRDAHYIGWFVRDMNVAMANYQRWICVHQEELPQQLINWFDEIDPQEVYKLIRKLPNRAVRVLRERPFFGTHSDQVDRGERGRRNRPLIYGEFGPITVDYIDDPNGSDVFKDIETLKNKSILLPPGLVVRYPFKVATMDKDNLTGTIVSRNSILVRKLVVHSHEYLNFWYIGDVFRDWSKESRARLRFKSYKVPYWVSSAII